MQGFLVSLCMAILEKLLVKGTEAFGQYLKLKAELEKNKAMSNEYDKVVNNPNATREERRNAEDDALS